MNAIKSIFNDLIERRLWPVALLLVASLIAVPTLLAKPSSESADSEGAVPTLPTPQDPGPIASAASGAAADVAVSVAPEAPDGAKLQGKAKNPFKQQHVPPKPKAPAATGAGAPSSGGGTPGTGDSGGTPDQPTGKTYVRAAIDVRFGQAGGRLRPIEDVPRLTPLPNAANPVAIFLGMRKDHETAVFLISSDVHVQGDGTCAPSKDDCEAIELKEGEIAFLDVKRANGVVDQYELDLVKVTIEQTTSKADAEASYARVSRAGARLMSRPHASSSGRHRLPHRPPFRYAEARGILHIAPKLSQRRRVDN